LDDGDFAVAGVDFEGHDFDGVVVAIAEFANGVDGGFAGFGGKSGSEDAGALF